jgi:hypothetical protein
MSNLRNIEQLRTNELQITKHGFWQPWFELTDGQFIYGKLSQSGFWKPTIILETAQKTWLIKRKGAFNRSLTIDDANGAEIGIIVPELFSNKIKLTLSNGFEATYLKKKTFSRTFSLISDQYGDIMDIKTALWTIKKPFNISITPGLAKSVPDIPLMALLGIKLIMIRQARANASAGVPI